MQIYVYIYVDKTATKQIKKITTQRIVMHRLCAGCDTL